MAEVSNRELSKTNISSPAIIERLNKWETSENSLAPLSLDQRNTCLDLAEEVSVKESASHVPGLCKVDKNIVCSNGEAIKTSSQFLEWYAKIDWSQYSSFNYKEYSNELNEKYQKLCGVLSQVTSILDKLNELKLHCEDVSSKTDSINELGKKLVSEQKKLQTICGDIDVRLLPFQKVDTILKQLDSQSLAVTSDSFVDLLDDIDSCMQHFRNHDSYLESNTYSIHANRSLSIALSYVKSYILNAFDACKSTGSSFELDPVSQTSAQSTKFVAQYGRFQANAHRLKPILVQLENRMENNVKYTETLVDCQRHYSNLRRELIQPSINESVGNLIASRLGNHCSLLRSLATSLIYVSQDEDKLYYQFFSKPSEIFTECMESICSVMYDTMRPRIIHIKHLESLAEICSILRVEFLQDHIKMSSPGMQAFRSIAEQLLQDVQERLVFRAHLYFKTDITEFRPSPGDLAYPEMLEMMKNIAEKINVQEMTTLSRSESRMSLNSISSAGDSMRSSVSRYCKHPINSSSSDMQGMWYPAVRRTLVCLSRLYRCIEKPIFQGLAQEAIACCTENVIEASRIISSTKTETDGYLFLIRHLLILREQIAPFQVDFTVKETTLDFSNLKTAAYSLLHGNNTFFNFKSNNSLLEFLLHGSPLLRENYLDSRKIVDQQLKTTCESFIEHVTKFAIAPIQLYLDKVQNYVNMIKLDSTNSVPSINEYEFGKPENVRSMLQECLRKLKAFVPNLQNMMALYLANVDTQFILFKPIKNNIVSSFTKLQTTLQQNYSKEDQLIIAAPNPEQISILLSSASLSSRKSSIVEKQKSNVLPVQS